MSSPRPRYVDLKGELFDVIEEKFVNEMADGHRVYKKGDPDYAGAVDKAKDALKERSENAEKAGLDFKYITQNGVKADGKPNIVNLAKSSNLRRSVLGEDEDGNPLELPGCKTPRGSRQLQLRRILMKELHAMDQANSASTSGSKACLPLCDEDKALQDMMDRYKKFLGKGQQKCNIQGFDKDRKIILLKAKKHVLESMSFAFLHGECEGTNYCNPFPGNSRVPKSLIACSGLQDAGALFFYDEDLASVGCQIAGKQKRGDSPAARGFCADFFETGTIAPGKGSTVWVNVCYPVANGAHALGGGEDDVPAPFSALSGGGALDNAHMEVRWVQCNELERAKHETLQAIDRAMKQQKRRILEINRQVLTLQTRLYEVNPMDADYASSDDEDYLVDNMKMYVTNSADRVRYRMMNKFAKNSLRANEEDLRMRAMHGPREDRAAFRRAMRKLGAVDDDDVVPKKSRSKSRSKSRRSKSRSSKSRSKSRRSKSRSRK